MRILPGYLFWYDKRVQGLGRDFQDLFEKLLYSVADSPLKHVEIKNGIRKAKFDKFPYGACYFVDNDIVVFQGVLHEKRGSAKLKELLKRK